MHTTRTKSPNTKVPNKFEERKPLSSLQSIDLNVGFWGKNAGS